MQINWFFWYTCSVEFFIAQNLLWRRAFVRAASSQQLFMLTLCAPAVYGYRVARDIFSPRFRHRRKLAICTMMTAFAVIGAENHLRCHAQSHALWRAKEDAIVKDEPALLILADASVDGYQHHVSLLHQSELPLYHRAEHWLMRCLYDAHTYDIDLDGYIDYDRHLELHVGPSAANQQ